MRLILFDIDGTLMDSGMAGTRALDYAFRDLYGIEGAFKSIPMAGMTDSWIVSQAMKKHNIPSGNPEMERVMSAYLSHLSREIDNPMKHLKPGIREILQSLGQRDDLVLGLLTGNFEQGAGIKLKSFGIEGYFRLGAYGSDHAERVELLPFAVKRFRASFGSEVRYEDCVIIGDTPMDVACSKPHGAKAVAVATGPYEIAELKKTPADLVIPDFSDPREFLNFLNPA